MENKWGMFNGEVIYVSEKNNPGCSTAHEEDKCGGRNPLASCGHTPGERW